jgi:hypothetical protein
MAAGQADWQTSFQLETVFADGTDEEVCPLRGLDRHLVSASSTQDRAKYMFNLSPDCMNSGLLRFAFKEDKSYISDLRIDVLCNAITL